MPAHVTQFNLKIWVLICHCLFPEEVALLRAQSLGVFSWKLFPHLMQVLFNLSLAVYNGNHDLYCIEKKTFQPFLELEQGDFTVACAKVYSLLHQSLPKHWSIHTDPMLVVAACRESINAARFGVEPREPMLALLNWLRNPSSFGRSLPLLDPREVEPMLFQAVREYVASVPSERQVEQSGKKAPPEFRVLSDAAISWLNHAVQFATPELRHCLDESRNILGLLHLARKSKCCLRMSAAQRRVLLYAKLCTSPLWELRGKPPPQLDLFEYSAPITKGDPSLDVTTGKETLHDSSKKHHVPSDVKKRRALKKSHLTAPHALNCMSRSPIDVTHAPALKSHSAPARRTADNAISPKLQLSLLDYATQEATGSYLIEPLPQAILDKEDAERDVGAVQVDSGQKNGARKMKRTLGKKNGNREEARQGSKDQLLQAPSKKEAAHQICLKLEKLYFGGKF